jgi:hypothetical protein
MMTKPKKKLLPVEAFAVMDLSLTSARANYDAAWKFFTHAESENARAVAQDMWREAKINLLEVLAMRSAERERNDAVPKV